LASPSRIQLSDGVERGTRFLQSADVRQSGAENVERLGLLRIGPGCPCHLNPPLGEGTCLDVVAGQVLLAHAGDHEGVVVVVDVLRAFTVAALALASGAAALRCVATVEQALALRASHPGSLVIGEVGGRRPEGFDLGNSPSMLDAAAVQGRTGLAISVDAEPMDRMSLPVEEVLYPALEEKLFIPRETVHRLSSADGGGPVRILEVSFGHFDEEDIVRLDDVYGRLSEQRAR
jgi:hypothetical protein